MELDRRRINKSDLKCSSGGLGYNLEKKRIRQSFEKQFLQHQSFDHYIDDQFKKMSEEKTENPGLIIPRGFRKFVQSGSFKELLKTTFEYMETLLDFEQQFEHIARSQGQKMSTDPLFKLLRYETDALESKCKQISYAYMGILLGYGDSKLVFKDQYFFETLIYFLAQIMKQNFEEPQFSIVEEELNRIFRTRTFNLVGRRHQEDQLYRKQPALKQEKYDGSASSLMKLQARLAIQKKNHYHIQHRLGKPTGIQRPANVCSSTFNSVRNRSPLISTFYPSEKHKLFAFAKQVREKQSFFKSRHFQTPWNSVTNKNKVRSVRQNDKVGRRSNLS